MLKIEEILFPEWCNEVCSITSFQSSGAKLARMRINYLPYTAIYHKDIIRCTWHEKIRGYCTAFRSSIDFFFFGSSQIACRSYRDDETLKCGHR